MIELSKKYSDYNYWANKRLIDKLRLLPDEILNKEQKSSFRTITATVLHINDAETVWMKRLEGISLTEWPSKDFNGSAYEALKLLENSSMKIKEYASVLTNEKLNEDCPFSSLDGKPYIMKIYDILQHAMNHSTFHRGQIVTMLRNLDITELPSTDYIAYLRSNAK